MRILIVDNNMDPACWGAADLRRFGTLSDKATVSPTVFVRRGPHDDLPKDISGFDKIILSGSRTSCLEEGKWISSLDQLIEQSLTLSKPLLGVCYGHQALNRVLGGREVLRRGTTPEYGWTKIETVSANALFNGLPETFYSFSAHFEEVAVLPAGMKLLARSEDCAIQAVQYRDLPVFGIQFHPEKDLADATATFAERKKKGEPKKLLHPNDSQKFFNPKVGETIFRNFLSL